MFSFIHDMIREFLLFSYLFKTFSRVCIFLFSLITTKFLLLLSLENSLPLTDHQIVKKNKCDEKTELLHYLCIVLISRPFLSDLKAPFH